MASSMRGPLGAMIGAIAVAVVGWLALPREAVIQRSGAVPAAPDVVFERVVDLELMQRWSPFSAKDPTLQVTFGPQRNGRGASYTWSGESGSGTWTITEVEPGKRVTSLLEMGNGASATSTMELAPSGEGTRVTWTVVAQGGGWTSGLFALNADSLIGPSLEDGLKRLGEVQP